MKNLKVTEVAEILGISADSVRKGIIDGTLEFGRCIRMKKNVFVIPEERFKNWLKGDKVWKPKYAIYEIAYLTEILNFNKTTEI